MMKIFVSAILSILLLGATAFATVSNTNNKDIYIADGTRTMWGYDFPIILTSDLTFYVIDNLGNQTQITSNYSINTSTSMVTYPVSGSPLTAGYIFVLLRSEPLTQGTSLKNQYRLPLDVIETSLDKLTMITQQLQEQSNRSILGSVNQSTAIVFPAPQASLFLAWDPTGSFLVNTPGIPGPQGPAGPAGAGSGNVNGPGTNTDSFVPQWNGVNSLLLKNGLGVGTSANNLLQLNSSAKIPAVDGSNVTNVNAISLNNKTVGTSANNIVSLNGSSQLPAVDGSLLTKLPLVPYIKITNTETQNTGGGALTDSISTFQTLPFNTKDTDSGSIATLTSNVLSLPAGTYEVHASTPVYNTGQNLTAQMRLYNNTTSAIVLNGQTTVSTAGNNQTFTGLVAGLDGRFTLSGSTNVVFQIAANLTANGNNLGFPGNFGPEVYATAIIKKVQ